MGRLSESSLELYSFGYFIATEYEESWFSTAKLHVGVVYSSVFDPRSGVDYVFRFVDERSVGMAEY